MTKSISNENFLESKKQVSFSPIEFEENIITDPAIPPNGFINNLKNIENNRNVINRNTNNELINDNTDTNIAKMVNNSIENDINNDIIETENNDTNMVNADTEPEDLHLNSHPTESNTSSYATELIDKAARAPHNRRIDLIKEEVNKLNNMNPAQRANLQVRNEIMQIFPLSIIIALIIFILLLIYVVGF